MCGMTNFYDTLSELALANVPFVSVILVDIVGSAPQEPGAKMLVTSEGLYYGTVGGGKIEKKAIEEAQRLLVAADPAKRTYFVQWSLTRDVGMTCGGGVKLYFEVINLNAWQIAVFGAGHVAQSLIRVLIGLDCQITCIDPRQEWLDKLPTSPKLKSILSSDMPSEVKNLPDHAFVLLITMGHATDKPILLEILKYRQFPYVGAIGSKAKAVRLKKDIVEAGLPDELASAFHCPVGLSVGSNHPQEIAISITAQLLQERDRLFLTE